VPEHDFATDIFIFGGKSRKFSQLKTFTKKCQGVVKKIIYLMSSSTLEVYYFNPFSAMSPYGTTLYITGSEFESSDFFYIMIESQGTLNTNIVTVQ
jgi:hypothetical protein